jgi:hypothetical protein
MSEVTVPSKQKIILQINTSFKKINHKVMNEEANFHWTITSSSSVFALAWRNYSPRSITPPKVL